MRFCNNIRVCILVLASFFLAFPVSAQLSKGEKDTIFVGEVKIEPSVINTAKKKGLDLTLERMRDSLQAQLTNAVNATRVFQLVVREGKDIDMEQALAYTTVDPNDKNAAEAENMTGAKFALLTRIDGFEDSTATTNYNAIGRSDRQRSVHLSAVVSVVDTTSGKILVSSSVQMNSSEGTELARMGTSLASDQLSSNLAKDIANKLVQEVVKLMRPAKILTVYGDATAVSAVSTDFGSSDLQQIASTVVDSLMTFPPVIEMTATRRPVLTVDRVKNNTMQHIDTESVTDSIRTKLIRSGKFRLIDRTTDTAAINEVRYQQESGLTKKGGAVQFGKQETSEFMLTATISEIEQKNSDVRDVYYKFTMNLKNLRTGILEWSDEKEIRKVADRPLFGR